MSAPLLRTTRLGKTFIVTKKTITALTDLNLTVEEGQMIALVGADGAGKTTSLRLIAGLLKPSAGSVDLAVSRGSVSYMPQKFGLYEDLTVQENLSLYASLYGLPPEEQEERFKLLLSLSSLENFTGRLAGKLSGGMKQKLGLICTLVRSPRLLLLDEPTVGVDPFSRSELWKIVTDLTKAERMSVILSTSYLDEAERCDTVVLLKEGKTICEGPPESIRKITEGKTFFCFPPKNEPARNIQSLLLHSSGITDALLQRGGIRIVRDPLEPAQKQKIDEILKDCRVLPTPSSVEDSVIYLNRKYTRSSYALNINAVSRDCKTRSSEVVIEAKHISKKFGSFTAVDNCSFKVVKGEVFGLLGPNGAGKTTTFRMLCGLLPPTEGELYVSGVNVRKESKKARAKVGYVAQKFSLYGQLSVSGNLDFFAMCYGLTGKKKEERIQTMLQDFSLTEVENMTAEELPGGYKRRLSMACALIHEPEILFLDEPTSGADPMARREFWMRITQLSAQGVTVIVTTHFMEEAEYCDRIIIQDSGKTIAAGTPQQVRSSALSSSNPQPSMEDAFIAIVGKHRGKELS